MTEHYLRSITADYITGVISACEGIHNSLVLTNGPLGCKFYHGYSSGQSLINSADLSNLRGELKLCDAMEDKLLRSQYFAGSPQNPATNLRYEDYIFGTREQLHRALNDIFTQRKYDFFTVIQSPGTSLLGEALERELEEIAEDFGLPYLYVEIPELSSDFCKGYDETTLKLLKKLLHERDAVENGNKTGPGLEMGDGSVSKDFSLEANGCRDGLVKAESSVGKTNKNRSGVYKSVNLFGFHTYEKFLEGGVNEIERLLKLCGVSLNCAVGYDCPIDQVKRLPLADANLVLSPERCHRTVDWLTKTYDMPLIETGGMPIGFDLTEEMLVKVGEVLEVDISPAIDDLEKGKARAFYYITRHLGPGGFPKELRYAVEGEYSLLAGYVSFISGYLGIMPACVHPLYEERNEKKAFLEKLLEEYGAQTALKTDIARCSNVILLGSSTTILEVTAYNRNIFGIEIANPTSGYVHVTPKTYVGVSGALYLLEQFINGNRLITAGQEIAGHWFPTAWK